MVDAEERRRDERRGEPAPTAGARAGPKFDKKTIALVYDFDGTLSPKPMQEYAFLPKIGADPEAFWAESNRLAKQTHADPLITYMHLMYKKAKAKGVRIDRGDLVAQGRHVELFPGRRGLVRRHRRLRQEPRPEPRRRAAPLPVSSGLTEIIEGTSIYKRFHNVFASEYWFEAYDLPYPKRVITDTGKTQYLFRINKGVEDLGESIAGLSAGGAMAAVMGATYPDLYAAIGVHSGLPYRAASDVSSAFVAMRGGSTRATREGRHRGDPRRVPAIVFHGEADQTVHPSNAERIVAAHRGSHGDVTDVESGVAGGRSYTRSIIRGRDGSTRVEEWRIRDAGHAWSGGNAEGSYTDAAGPCLPGNGALLHRSDAGTRSADSIARGRRDDGRGRVATSLNPIDRGRSASRQSLQDRDLLEEVAPGLGRRADEDLAGADIRHDPGLRCDLRALPDLR